MILVAIAVAAMFSPLVFLRGFLVALGGLLLWGLAMPFSTATGLLYGKSVTAVIVFSMIISRSILEA